MNRSHPKCALDDVHSGVTVNGSTQPAGSAAQPPPSSAALTATGRDPHLPQNASASSARSARLHTKPSSTARSSSSTDPWPATAGGTRNRSWLPCAIEGG
eukprot:TRINITY_DN5465_c0_g1_i3.p2 TRINITY_DN5465_c0_g1~~TRINITY_DN5465_c0_g1_i3.p2  ORF type:complete len:100 (-),score=12.46 TRINITY_DN5465_c0_g1_i3:103-402(-)